jgi:hypothetical protein
MIFKKLFSKIKKEKDVIEGEATKDKTYSSKNEFPSEEDAVREFKKVHRKIVSCVPMVRNAWNYLYLYPV